MKKHSGKHSKNLRAYHHWNTDANTTGKWLFLDILKLKGAFRWKGENFQQAFYEKIQVVE